MQHPATLALLALLPLPGRAASTCQNVGPIPCPECFAVEVAGTSLLVSVGLERGLGRPGG